MPLLRAEIVRVLRIATLIAAVTALWSIGRVWSGITCGAIAVWLLWELASLALLGAAWFVGFSARIGDPSITGSLQLYAKTGPPNSGCVVECDSSAVAVRFVVRGRGASRKFIGEIPSSRLSDAHRHNLLLLLKQRQYQFTLDSRSEQILVESGADTRAVDLLRLVFERVLGVDSSENMRYRFFGYAPPERE